MLKEPVPRLPSRFSPVLAEALWRAMAKDPDYRYESLTEFAAALNAAESDLGLQATALPFDPNVTPVVPAAQPQASPSQSAVPDELAAVAPPVRTGPPASDGERDVVEPESAGGETEAQDGNRQSLMQAHDPLNESGTPVADAPVHEPAVPGAADRVVFSDGRVEQLDGDVIVGRNPERTPLEQHQRAVVAGEGDRTVSRRHVELQAGDRQVIAVCLGQHAAVVAADGASSDLTARETYVLVPGDTLHFGTSTWLRYETGPSSHGDNDDLAGAHGDGVDGDSGEVPAEPDTKVRDSTTSNLDLASLADPGSRPTESVGPDQPARPADAADATPADADRSAEPQSEWSVLFSDGSVEQIDAELIIGRSPMREPLEPHQRGVVQGVGDRTVSRRHIELRVGEDGPEASNLGRFTALRYEAGGERELVTGELVQLQPGDELRFGTESWLRYAPSDADAPALQASPRHDRHANGET